MSSRVVTLATKLQYRSGTAWKTAGAAGFKTTKAGVLQLWCYGCQPGGRYRLAVSFGGDQKNSRVTWVHSRIFVRD